MEDFVVLLKKLLVAEFFCSEEEAKKLVKDNLGIVTQGILSNRLRATAMALGMKKDQGEDNASITDTERTV